MKQQNHHIMKRTLLFLLLYLSIPYVFSQTLNQEVTDEKGKAKLLGPINKKGLEKPAYTEWFNKNYDDYDINSKVVKKIKDSLNDYSIKVFLGTWCGDSRKEVPRFYAILNAAKFPENQLEVFALDNVNEAYKQGPNGEEKDMNIHRVPTFIFYKNGHEVNRIVEHPKETLERDIFKIVNGKRYTPNYIAANYLQNLLEDKSLDSLKLLEHDLVPRLSEFVKGSSELNTLGYVNLRANNLGKALYIFHLNAKIFPYKYNVYDSLAEAYLEAKNYTEALKNYYKVLSLKPEDENAIEMIDRIKEQMK